MPENQNEITENANLTLEQQQQYERLMVEIEEREKKREVEAEAYSKFAVGMFVIAALATQEPIYSFVETVFFSVSCLLLGVALALMGLAKKRTWFTKGLVYFLGICLLILVAIYGPLYLIFELIFGGFAPY